MTTRFQALTVIVVGGGMIGLTAALGLRQQGHTVHLVERAGRPNYGADTELRVSALAHRSRALLAQLGV